MEEQDYHRIDQNRCLSQSLQAPSLKAATANDLPKGILNKKRPRGQTGASRPLNRWISQHLGYEKKWPIFPSCNERDWLIYLIHSGNLLLSLQILIFENSRLYEFQLSSMFFAFLLHFNLVNRQILLKNFQKDITFSDGDSFN